MAEWSTETKKKEGWLAKWEIASLLVLDFKKDAEIINAEIEDCEERPHEKPSLAKLGHMQYYYVKQGMTTEKDKEAKKVEAQASADIKNKKEWDYITTQLSSGSSRKALGAAPSGSRGSSRAAANANAKAAPDLSNMKSAEEKRPIHEDAHDAEAHHIGGQGLGGGNRWRQIGGAVVGWRWLGMGGA